VTRRQLFYPWVAAINLLVLVGFLLYYLNATYPQVGHDYALFVPRLIDTYLHTKVNGLAIQWFTPSFGGGIPVYPNPQDLQLTITQFLTWLVDPWVAIMISAAIYLTLGFIAALDVFRRFFHLGMPASILGAWFFTANGFYFQHLAVGHVTFQPFPILAVIVWVLLHPKLPVWLAGILLSFLVTILLYAGAIYLLVIFIFSLAVLLPLIYLLKPELISPKRLIKIGLVGGGLTILMCGSRLGASIAYTQSFPRLVSETYPAGTLSALLGVLVQLAGSMTIAPLLIAIGKSPMVLVVRLQQWSGSPYSFWELDTSVSPVLWILIGAYLVIILTRLKKIRLRRLSGKQLLAAGLMAIAIYCLLEYILARGFIFPYMHDLPVIRSLRVNSRMTAAFILPLVVLGAMIFDRWMNHLQTPGRQWGAFLVINSLALASLGGMLLLPVQLQVRNFELPSALMAYKISQQTGDVFPVEQISPEMNDWEVFQGRSSTLRTQETLFDVEYHPVLQAGSVYLEQDGYFNMNHPAGFVYPRENDTAPFGRIPVSERLQLEDFVNRRQPDWNLPAWQVGLNWVSTVSMLASASLLTGWTLWRAWKQRQNY
jgi:hypothetical protein